MLVSWSASPILVFAVSLNSLSISHSRRRGDSEFRETANGTPAETFVTAAPIADSLSFDSSRSGDFLVKRIADAAAAGDENVLHHEDRDDSLFGVDPAVRGERSAVTERAR